MGKIIIYHERHNKNFFQKYWGLIIFPLLPFWALAHDDGMAGYLDVDGVSYKLKHKKKIHPQVINIPVGQHEIIYRKTSKFTIAFNNWATETSGTLGEVLDSLDVFDDFKEKGFIANFGNNTELILRAEGGVLRNLKIVDVTNVPPSDDYRARTPGSTPAPPKKSKGFGVAFVCALVVFLASAAILINKFQPIKQFTNNGSSSDLSTNESSVSTNVSTNESLNKTMYVAVRETVLNLRVAPNTDAEIIATMPKNATVTVHKISDGWAYVSYNDAKGYCSTDYLSEQKQPTTNDSITNGGVSLSNDAIIGQWRWFDVGLTSTGEKSVTVFEWTFNPDNSCSVSANYCFSHFDFKDERKSYRYDGQDWFVGSGDMYRGTYSLNGTKLTVVMDTPDPDNPTYTTTAVYSISVKNDTLYLHNLETNTTIEYIKGN